MDSPFANSRRRSANHLDRHRRRFAATDADGCDTLAQATLAQGGDQGDENTRTGCAYRVTQGAGPAVDVDPGVVQAQLTHGDHADHGKCLVDFKQIHFVETPSSTLQQASNGADGCSREQPRCVGKRRMPAYHCLRRQAQPLSFALAAQHQRSRTIGNRTGLSRCDRAALAEGGSEWSALPRHRLRRLLVVTDFALLSPLYNLERDDLFSETATGNGVAGTLQRSHGIGVLFLSAKAVALRAVLGEGTHQPPFVVGVFQAVEK